MDGGREIRHNRGCVGLGVQLSSCGGPPPIEKPPILRLCRQWRDASCSHVVRQGGAAQLRDRSAPSTVQAERSVEIICALR